MLLLIQDQCWSMHHIVNPTPPTSPCQLSSAALEETLAVLRMRWFSSSPFFLVVCLFWFELIAHHYMLIGSGLWFGRGRLWHRCRLRPRFFSTKYSRNPDFTKYQVSLISLQPWSWKKFFFFFSLQCMISCLNGCLFVCCVKSMLISDKRSCL